MAIQIGLVIKSGVGAAIELARQVAHWTDAQGHELLVDHESSKVLDHFSGVFQRDELAARANPIITLGGDGTLISVARHVYSDSPVLIGVNFGCLGFLTEVSPQDLFGVLDAVLGQRAHIAVRSMLAVEVNRADRVIFSSQAVNEAVVIKGASDRLLALDLAVNHEDVSRIKADGLIVATPTGSTAYSLSAGGSIVAPWLSVVLVTPICAHSLTSRPLVIDNDSLVEIGIPQYEGEVFVNVDGQVSHALQTGDIVRLRRSPNSVKFVRSSSQSYFEILRTKLNWGLTNHGCS